MGVLTRKSGLLLLWLLATLCSAVLSAGCGVKVRIDAGKKAGEVKTNSKDGADMVWVPAGEFIMGSSAEDIAALLKAEPQFARAKEAFADEKPQHRVYLDGYWMYRNEVTRAQYREFCKAARKRMPEAPNPDWRDDYPITNVAWQDAADYGRWAGVSLPTEAQWEKASRGTDGRIYPSGDKLNSSKYDVLARGPKKFQPVGSLGFNKSPYGCMDMGGNVWEWCMDWYAPNYYRDAPQRNPTGPLKAVTYSVSGIAFSGLRVLRAGSFRCTDRNGLSPTLTNPYFGFRCAKTP